MNRIFDTIGLVIGLATITTVVSRSESAQVIRAFGDAFSQSLRTALRD